MKSSIFAAVLSAVSAAAIPTFTGGPTFDVVLNTDNNLEFIINGLGENKEFFLYLNNNKDSTDMIKFEGTTNTSADWFSTNAETQAADDVANVVSSNNATEGTITATRAPDTGDANQDMVLLCDGTTLYQGMWEMKDTTEDAYFRTGTWTITLGAACKPTITDTTGNDFTTVVDTGSWEALWSNLQAFFGSDQKTLISRGPELVLSEEFWSGFGLGIQADQEDTGSACYGSFMAMYTTINTADIEFLTYAASVISKGETPSDLGFLSSLFETYTEFSLVYFNMYVDCAIELLLISVGKITSSNAGAGDFLLVVGLSLYEYFWNGEGTVRALDAALQGNDKVMIGVKLGSVI